MRALDSVPMPPQIAALDRDARGYPVPFFVARPPHREVDIRFSDHDKPWVCQRTGVCWVCGRPRGEVSAFLMGPMSVLNRVTTEGPCHEDCARYSAAVCPALNGEMVKRTRKAVDGPVVRPPGGVEELPKVVCVYSCRRYRAEPHAGHLYFRVGPSVGTAWYGGGVLLPGGPGREVMEAAAREIAAASTSNAGRHFAAKGVQGQ